MTPRKHPPLLLVSGLTKRVYIVTRYRRPDPEHPDFINASEKYDVTEQFEAIAKERLADALLAEMHRGDA